MGKNQRWQLAILKISRDTRAIETILKINFRLVIIYSEGVGSVLFRPIKNGKQYRDVEFTRVLHVPALRNNLLSVLYLTKYKGVDVHISAITMDFFDQKSWLFSATIIKVAQ